MVILGINPVDRSDFLTDSDEGKSTALLMVNRYSTSFPMRPSGEQLIEQAGPSQHTG